MPPQSPEYLVRKDFRSHDGLEKVTKNIFPFFAMGLGPMTMMLMNMKMGHFMNVCYQEQVGMKIVVDRYLRCLSMFATEVTNL